jgi:hypothetical protein
MAAILGVVIGLSGASAVTAADATNQPSAATATASPASSTPTSPAEPTTQDLLSELRALKSKVQQLETAEARLQQQQQQTQRLAQQETPQTIGQVLTDADRRSQLLQPAGFTAGYTNGRFLIQSEDGDFLLNPNFQFQARYVLNYRDENAANATDGHPQTEAGLEIRRMKFALDGNVFGRDTTYKFQWASLRSTGELQLEQAWVAHRLAAVGLPDLTVRVGQYKDPTFHEEFTSSRRQLAVDRTLVNFFLGGQQTKYVQGVSLLWDDGQEGRPLRGEVGITDGPSSRDTSFVDAGGSTFLGLPDPNFGLNARGEYLAFGDWRNYDDFSAQGNAQDLLVFGAGAFYSQAGGSSAVHHTIDAQYETGPLALYAAYLGVAADRDDTGHGYSYGFLAQAGYLLTQKVEPYLRYDYTQLDGIPTATGEDAFHEFTAGVNYYLHGHAAKLTVDFVYLPSGAPATADGLGILAPDAGDDQIVFRSQFQLLL